MTTFLKFLHLAAISVWSGGLIILPVFLFPGSAEMSRTAPNSIGSTV